jgi:hypothetical protein
VPSEKERSMRLKTGQTVAVNPIAASRRHRESAVMKRLDKVWILTSQAIMFNP